MKLTTFTLLLCLLFSISTKAQTQPYQVKGNVSDSTLRLNLFNTSVSVLNAKDSTLRHYTRVTGDGNFTIDRLGKGSFILLVTYPGYADYVENFTLDSINRQHNFGNLYMVLKATLLKNVIVKGTAAAIKIKGDTTEFNPKAFSIQPNSKVEDLLKQLPGISVDKDGKITAQGQNVPKVLVDGEEFFGDDPTLVTKNLRADMVDKVQLYDKKSDQAAFTGVDDGQKTKTINIVLKEDAKNGFFGKLEGAKGTDGYYSTQALFNRFKKKMKFSVYGVAANTGKLGLGWSDNSKLGTGSTNSFVADDGNTYFTNSGGSDLDSYSGQYDGRGIPVARAGGAHYDNKWAKDNQIINANYKIGYLAVDGTASSQSQRTLSGSSINNTDDNTFNNSIFRQKVDAQYTLKMDTSTTLKITADGLYKDAKTSTTDKSSSTQGLDTLLNTNSKTLTNDVISHVYNVTALYTKKLKKVGRTFSWGVSEAINNSDAKGYLNALLTTYNPTTHAATPTVTDQYKTTDLTSNILSSNMSYTEPLNKYLSLVANYGLTLNNSVADRKSFNKNGNLYNSLDTTYSNNYKFNQVSNQFGAIFNYKSLKYLVNVGTRATAVDFDQVDQIKNTTYHRDFLNWQPMGSVQYKLGTQKTLRLYYNGNTTQPTIDQLQPVKNNNDNLNIYQGNAGLRPSFSNNFSFGYSSYKVLSDEWIGFNANYNFVTSAIINSTAYNRVNGVLTGTSTFQSVNLVGHDPYNYNFSVYLDKKIKKLGFNLSPNLSTNTSVSYSLVDGALNTTTNHSYSGRMGFNKYKEKKYDFWISAGPSYTRSSSSLYPATNNNGYNFNGNGSFNIYLPLKFQIASDGEYVFRGATATFADPYSRTVINSSISKTFFKNDNLKLTASGNDILNQNTGFSQSTGGGVYSRSTNTTIRRYFMLTISWDFTKMGGGAAAAPAPQK